nr:serine hydrolase domain-containing protein [Paenibacillus hamazuiensis]
MFVSIAIFNFFGQNALAQAAVTDEDIDRFIQAKMEKNSIPGLSVAITRGDRVVLAKGYGKTDGQTPVSADTPFAVASLSKSFTAFAVMQLAEEGLIDLDAPLARYVKSFRLNDRRGSAITIRQLMKHTSGVTDTAYPDMTVNGGWNKADSAYRNTVDL